MSSGRLLATTFNFGIIFLTSISFILFNSSLVKTISSSLVKSPISFAILIAVNLLSPVIITVCIPDSVTFFIPSIVLGLISSFINIKPKNTPFVKLLEVEHASTL